MKTCPIAPVMTLCGEDDSPAFALLLNRRVLQGQAESVAGFLTRQFAQSVRHEPSADAANGIDSFIFTAPSAEARPELARAVVAAVAPEINNAFAAVTRCVSFCMSGCHDDIQLPWAADEAARAFAPGHP